MHGPPWTLAARAVHRARLAQHAPAAAPLVRSAALAGEVMPVVTRCGSVHEVAGWPPHRIPCQMIVAAGTEYARGNHTGLHAGETVRPRKAWFWGEWKPLWPLPAFTLPQLRETGVDGRTPDYPFLARAWEVRLLPQRELWRIACRLLGLPDWMVSR